MLTGCRKKQILLYLLYPRGLVVKFHFFKFQVHIPASGNRAECFGRDQRTAEQTPNAGQRLSESAARYGGGLWVQWDTRDGNQ